MSEGYTKPEKSLVATPVEELCGNPNEQTGGAGVSHGGDPVGQKESGGTPTVTYYSEPGTTKS